MPRFIRKEDMQFINRINKELIDDVLDVKVNFFRLDDTEINIYGETNRKCFKRTSVIPCKVEVEKFEIDQKEYGTDRSRYIKLFVMVSKMKELDFYPTVGDIVEHDGIFYEIYGEEYSLLQSRENALLYVGYGGVEVRISEISVDSNSIYLE